MVSPLPKWIMKRYAKLWVAFGNREFSFDKASKKLNEKDNRIIAVIISDLNKAGWITVKRDPNNLRKKLYRLKKPEEAIIEMTK